MRYFLDTEFDGYGGPLLSLALVREDGAGVYYVLRDRANDEWVRRNVLPILYAARVGGKMWERDAAAMDIAWFLRDDPEPVIVTDWPADIRYFCELIEFPAGQMAPIAQLAFELHRVDAYPTTLPDALQHNAWWDAMALRQLLSARTPPAERPRHISTEGRSDGLPEDEHSPTLGDVEGELG